MARELITTLYALPRQCLGTFHARYMFDPATNEDVQECIAEWADVDPEEVEWTELDEGEFLTVGGDPVGFVEKHWVDVPEIPARFLGLPGRA